VLGLAAAMGRTLVLPPEKEMYLLRTSKGKHGKQRDTFSFNHFFHMDAIHNEHTGLDIISMETFLLQEAMTGHMRNTQTGAVSFPPRNLTQWDGLPEIFQWLRDVSHVDIWVPEECMAVFPASRDPSDMADLRALEATIQRSPPKFEDYIGHPVPIDGTPMERMKENWADRSKLCIYDERMQEATFVHFPVDSQLQARLLVHFYAFLFFQDWKQDLWMKRYVDCSSYSVCVSDSSLLAHSFTSYFVVATDLSVTMLGILTRYNVRRLEWWRRFANTPARTIQSTIRTACLMRFTFGEATFSMCRRGSMQTSF
jgi:GDP-fucose protein O-fucosyltransferase